MTEKQLGNPVFRCTCYIGGKECKGCADEKEDYKKCLIEAKQFGEEMKGWFNQKIGRDAEYDEPCNSCALYEEGELCPRCKELNELVKKCRQFVKDIEVSVGEKK